MEPDIIYADLWKASQLVTNSHFFPAMVRVAAVGAGKEYTEHLLYTVAQKPSIVGAIGLRVGESIDTAILNLMTESPEMGEAIDTVIRNAVTAYVPPASS